LPHLYDVGYKGGHRSVSRSSGRQVSCRKFTVSPPAEKTGVHGSHRPSRRVRSVGFFEREPPRVVLRSLLGPASLIGDPGAPAMLIALAQRIEQPRSTRLLGHWGYSSRQKRSALTGFRARVISTGTPRVGHIHPRTDARVSVTAPVCHFWFWKTLGVHGNTVSSPESAGRRRSGYPRVQKASMVTNRARPASRVGRWS